MSTKKRGLSKGLESLLPPGILDVTSSAKTVAIKNKIKKREKSAEIIMSEEGDNDPGIKIIQVTQLGPSRFQPRKQIQESELEPLAESIRAQGVLQPIVARKIAGSNRYEIIAGERRWRAAQLAGLTEVPVIPKAVSDEAAMAIGLIENIQREDLSPLEEAVALDKLSKEFGLTHEQTAKAVGKSRASISNLLRLLTLRVEVKTFLERGDIDFGHAKVLLGVQGTLQVELAKCVVTKRLSVRETEHLVQQAMAKQNRGTEKHLVPTRPDPDIQRLQQRISETMGAKVSIRHSLKGRGKIVIAYNNLDELDGILAHIK